MKNIRYKTFQCVDKNNIIVIRVLNKNKPPVSVKFSGLVLSAKEETVAEIVVPVRFFKSSVNDYSVIE